MFFPLGHTIPTILTAFSLSPTSPSLSKFASSLNFCLPLLPSLPLTSVYNHLANLPWLNPTLTPACASSVLRGWEKMYNCAYCRLLKSMLLSVWLRVLTGNLTAFSSPTAWIAVSVFFSSKLQPLLPRDRFLQSVMHSIYLGKQKPRH